MRASDQDGLEQKKLQELLDSTVSLLGCDLAKFMDSYTLDQLSKLRDLVDAWLQGNSPLTHEQMISEVTALSNKLSAVSQVLLLDENLTRH